MARFNRVLAVVFGVAMLGAEWIQPAVLACHGMFGRFADGTLVDKPSRLNFIVDWQVPAVATESGRPGRIIALSSTALDFEIQYDGYKAVYQVNRLDGTIREASTLGSVFSGVCELKPFAPKF